MDTFFKTTGVMVVSAIIVSIPLLCGLSIALSWDVFIQWILILATLGIYGLVSMAISE